MDYGLTTKFLYDKKEKKLNICKGNSHHVFHMIILIQTKKIQVNTQR